MSVVSAAQVANGASDTTETSAGNFQVLTVTPTVDAGERWQVRVQVQSLGGTWKTVADILVKQGNVNSATQFVVKPGLELRTDVQGINGSTLKIEID